MDEVMYSKLNMNKTPGCPLQMKSHLEGNSTVLYAEIATSSSKSHLPAVVSTPEVTENPVRKSKYIIFFRVLVIIIILILCCALGYMVYHYSNINDENCRTEMKKQLCVNSTVTLEGCALCPNNWLLYGDNCYYYSHVTQRTWSESQEQCEMMGGHLLVIEDQRQQVSICRVLTQQTDDKYWIGLYQAGDGWRWVTGRHYNTSLFQLEDNTENCALMDTHGYYTESCNSTTRFICQRKAVKI